MATVSKPPKFSDPRVVDLGVSGIGVHPVGGFGVPHKGCECGTCEDARIRQLDAIAEWFESRSP
jgi:hypothetical protein